MIPLRIFCGFDPREAAGFHAFVSSVLEHAEAPVSITPLWDARKSGTNAFHCSRFRVPYLCGFHGWALWVDGSDMLCRTNIADIFTPADHTSALFVVKHEYTSKATRKYIGTAMEADNVPYPRKNWSSVILWDCGHPLNRILTKEYVEEATPQHLHRFGWLPDEKIGSLDPRWNHLVGEQSFRHDAKIAHFTLGLPAFDYYAECDYADEWRAAWRSAGNGIQYDMEMASSR